MAEPSDNGWGQPLPEVEPDEIDQELEDPVITAARIIAEPLKEIATCLKEMVKRG